MKTGRGSAARSCAVALALCIPATDAAAASRCASPEEMTALKVAALRQQLMVAALTCHEARSFNQFVTNYRERLQRSDQALMRFFLRRNESRADEAYNAYKTRMANNFSLRSLSDPWFCGNARASLRIALARDLPLEELVRTTPVATGFGSCMADESATFQPLSATPTFPPRHAALPEDNPASPAAASPAAETAAPARHGEVTLDERSSGSR